MEQNKEICDFQKIIQLTDKYIGERLALNDDFGTIGTVSVALAHLESHIEYLKKTYTKKLGPGCL